MILKRMLSIVAIVLAVHFSTAAGDDLALRMDAVHKEIAARRYRQVAARVFDKIGTDEFSACAADAAYRIWHRAFLSKVEPEADDQNKESAVLVALEGFARKRSKVAEVYLALYWHEAAFESFREDQPDEIKTSYLRDASGRVVIDHRGQPVKEFTYVFTGPDKQKMARVEEYFKRARQLAPGNREVLYIEALHEKDAAKRYDLFLRSYRAGGKDIFGLGFLDKLADSAQGAGKADDAAKWRSMLNERIAAEPNGLNTRLYLAMKKKH